MLYTYWKGTLISKWYEIPEKECLQHGKDLIEKSLREGVSIKSQIFTYNKFMNILKRKKDRKESIKRSDHLLGFHTLFALAYLKIIELDDDQTGTLIINQKKRRTYP
tara:strand:+ start:355 stop:675 length:321 start_codon:yes stop_codon:yes gene_type:complete